MCDTTDGETVSVADCHDALNQLFESQATTQDVVLSVVGLGRAEMWSYVVLVEHPDSDPGHISDILGRHRRHTARALRELHDAGLVEREKRPCEGGGWGYFYQPIPVEEMKQYLREKLDKWTAHVENDIENFDTDIETEHACDGATDNNNRSHEAEN